jgi:hypothetical protein
MSVNSLVHIDLHGCYYIPDRGVAAVADKCTNLRTIVLQHTKVGDTTAMLLARGCTKLQSINFNNTAVTDAGVSALVERCPELRVVCLENCKVGF